MIFIDTNIAIALRDAEPDTRRRIADLGEPPVISIMTRIELENGAHREPAGTGLRRQLLDRMLRTMPVIFFDHSDINAYSEIVHKIGFVKGLTIDRLIAAQALARDAALITRNGRDFRRIDGLRLIEWETSSPTPPPS